MQPIFTTRVLPKNAAPVLADKARMQRRLSDSGPLELKDHGFAIAGLQRYLRATGLLKAKVSGKFGYATRNAVRAFQSQKGLKVTGVVDARTLAALVETQRVVKPGFVGSPARLGQRGEDIRKAEALLKKLGFATGAVDGKLTWETLRASKAFERLNPGFGDDGAIGHGQLVAMRKAAALEALGTPIRTQGYDDGIATPITVYPVGNGEYLRADAALAFTRMMAAAKKAGISLSCVSGFRTMAEQRILYARWLNGTGNLAARPGYSNHQTGISMDIGGVGGYSTRAYAWLAANARKFGFVNDVKGEYWHWTFAAGK